MGRARGTTKGTYRDRLPPAPPDLTVHDLHEAFTNGEVRKWPHANNTSKMSRGERKARDKQTAIQLRKAAAGRNK